MAGIQRHIREECRRHEIHLFNYIAFSSFRGTLDAVLKEKVSEGMGVVKYTETLTNNNENELWEKGVINKKTSNGLSYGVFFYNSKVFGLRGLSEHKDLKAEQFIVSNGQIVFQKFVSKTVKGA